jgi:hypothetical protein
MWDAVDVSGTERVQGSVLTTEIAEKEGSTEAIMESSTQQTMRTSSQRNISLVSEPEGGRKSVTGEVAQESMQEVTKLSTQQGTAQISSEITQQTTQSELLILDTVLTTGENSGEYNRLHGRNARGMLVGHGSPGQFGSYISRNVINILWQVVFASS